MTRAWTIRRQSPRAAIAAAMCIGLLMCHAPATGQTIEFTRAIKPPAISGPSLAAALVGIMEREASDLNASASAAESAAARITLTARANWRLLAAELLAAGDRDDAAGDIAWLNGLKLCVNREAFDQLASIKMPPETSDGKAIVRTAMIESLASFNSGFAEHVQRGGGDSPQTQPAATQEWLALLLSRLVPIVAPAGGHALESHWIAPRRSASTTIAPDVSGELAALRLRAVEVAVDDATRAALLSIIEYLERGWRFSELTATVNQHRRMIESMLDSADAISAAAWLRDEQQAAMLEQVTGAIVAFLDPERRESVADDVQMQRGLRRMLIAATELQADNVDTRKLCEIVDAASNAMNDADATDGSSVRAWALAANALELMVAARAVAADRSNALTRDLRTIERDLLKDYRNVEAKMLKELAAGTLYCGSLADPGLASLLSDHRERVEELAQLRRIPEWNAAIGQIYPPAAKDFEIQMRKRAQALLVPTKRAEARMAIERFEDELTKYEQLPFEQAMRDGDAAAVSLTGGLHEQIVAQITEKRRAWADAWSRSEFDPAAVRAIALLHRLSMDLLDAAALVEVQPAALNRWPAWQVSVELINAGQSNVATRLRLACAAAVAGDEAGLQDQLDRIDRESPLAKLAGRLMQALGNDLREEEDGMPGVLAQMTIAPSDDAAFLDARAVLAAICRYAAETDHARGGGNRNIEMECSAYVDALASRLLEQMSQK